MNCCWVLTALKIIETNIYWVSGTIPGTICQLMSLLLIINLWGRNHYCLHFTDKKTEAQAPAVAKKLPAAHACTAPCRPAGSSACCAHLHRSVSACRLVPMLRTLKPLRVRLPSRPRVCFPCRFFWIWGRILICRGPAPADPGYSKERRRRRRSGNHCLIKC